MMHPSVVIPAYGWKQLISNPRTPIVLLLVLSALSLGSRLGWISNPTVLVFDENYYVNAARKMIGLPVPADEIYAKAPVGVDPNFAHPPLAKAFIASSIQMLGNRPIGWRLPSIAFGTVAILALFAVARAVGFSPWASLGAGSLMAADPLFVVHGRIGTLDIFALAFMLIAAALYLRERPVVAGLVVGIGACTKLVTFSVLFIFGLLLLFQIFSARGAGKADGKPAIKLQVRNLAATIGIALASYLGLLLLLDLRFTNFDNPIEHTQAMVAGLSQGGSDPSLIDIAEEDYKNRSESQRRGYSGPIMRQKGQNLYKAPTSHPWEWLANQEQITFYRFPSPRGPVSSWTLLGRPSKDLVVFDALVNPAIIVIAIPALLFGVFAAWRRREGAGFLPAAWFLGTFGPYLVADLAGARHAGFLYYMLIVVPAIYLAASHLLSSTKAGRLVAPVFALAVVAGFLVYYPFKTWGGV